MIRRLAWALALGIAAASCSPTPGRFPINWERMRDQPKGLPYGTTPAFGNGAVMQPLPPDVVPLEEASLPPAVLTGLDRGREVTEIPLAVSHDMVERGRNRYDIFCAPCHDLDGTADTPVAKNMQLRQPPSLVDPRLLALPVGQVFRVITEGYGLMPSYAYQLPVVERWDVIAYERALELSRQATLAELPPDVRADALRALGGGRP